MKNLIQTLLFLLCFQVVCQEVKTLSGVTIYKSHPNKKHLEGLKKGKKSDVFIQMYKLVEHTKFILKFNDSESFFEVEKKMDSDLNPMGFKIAKTMVGGGSYYTNLKDTTLIRKTETGGEDILISMNLPPISSWKITKESKTIKGFKCFKATKTKIITNPKGTFNFEIIAWFAPEIPARFGPKEFNNLPGLILELQDTHHTLYLDTIKFLKKAPKIKPFKGDIITEEAYLKISRQNLNNFRDRIKKN